MTSTTAISARPYLLNEANLDLKVNGQDGRIVYFKINRHTRLRKLFEAYCSRQSLSCDQIRFLFVQTPVVQAWGHHLSGDQTPDCLGMENDDVIDAMLVQVGD
eukprot:1984905-Rhodomonas_salina.1